jgi:glycosyltransferase involved in cell wall biosynthesis
MKKPLHIALDGNEANVSQRVGSNVYAFELLTALEKLTQKRPDISFTVLLSKVPLAELPPSRTGWGYKTLGPQPLWTQWALPLHLYTHKKIYSLFFTPGHYAPRLCPIPYISTVMDTAYLEFPNHFKPLDLFQLKHWTAYSVKGASKVVAISKATKYSIVKHYHRKPEDIIVAYPALTPSTTTLNPHQKRDFFGSHNITEPYILFLGTLQPRKNITTLVTAFELLLKRLRTQDTSSKNTLEPSLVLAGKVGWLAEPTLQKIAQSPVRDKIILTGFITEAEKKVLIERANSLVLIGLHEGFGIPPLEALSLGTVPIVSNTSSLPEVVGEAGITVPPEIPSVLARFLEKILTLPQVKKRVMQKKGKDQAAKFSWEKSANIVLHTILTEAAAHNDRT